MTSATLKRGNIKSARKRRHIMMWTMKRRIVKVNKDTVVVMKNGS